MKTPIIGPAQRTPAWYAIRRNPDDPQFGATDAAALLGVSEWKTPRHVYESFFTEPEPENEAMRSGRHLEPAVQAMWAEEHGKFVLNDVPALLDQVSPIFASLDSLVWADYPHGLVRPYLSDDRPADFCDSILEIKTSMSRAVAERLGNEGTDVIPTDWLCQVQQQMEVTGLEVTAVAVLLFGRLTTYNVAYNADLGSAIRERSDEMRQRILHRDPPPLDFDHLKTPELVRSLRVDEGVALELPGDIVEWWTASRLAAKDIKAAEQDKSEWTARVEAWMVEHGATAGLLPDGKKIVRRSVTRKGYSVEPKTFVEMREVKA